MWVSWSNLQFMKNECAAAFYFFGHLHPGPRCQINSISFCQKRGHTFQFLLAHLSEGGEAVVHGVAPLLVHEAGVGPGIVTVVSQRQRPGP